jgi:uncharacterized NAD(P)/FAD-binding protein YdhS
MSDKHIPTIAIIGGGFSGASVAWHLRKLAVAADIVIIEPRPEIGRGLAYSTIDPAHRINVPAFRMNIDADADDHFPNWLARTKYLEADPQAALANGKLFPSREAFGSYVRDQIASLANPVRRIAAKAANVEKAGERFRVTCESGEAIDADCVVMAICHAPPDTPASLASSAHYQSLGRTRSAIACAR